MRVKHVRETWGGLVMEGFESHQKKLVMKNLEDTNSFHFLCFISFIDNAIEAIDEFAFLEGNVILFS